jgi:hypothetical protein
LADGQEKAGARAPAFFCAAPVGEAYDRARLEGDFFELVRDGLNLTPLETFADHGMTISLRRIAELHAIGLL